MIESTSRRRVLIGVAYAWELDPSIVPNGYDQNIYIVVDDFGKLGRAYRETDVERTDHETTVTDLMSGQYSDPVRIVAFTTVERWAEDVSEDIARENLRRRSFGREQRKPRARPKEPRKPRKTGRFWPFASIPRLRIGYAYAVD